MKTAILITFLVATSMAFNQIATSMAFNQALAQEEYEISPSPQEFLDVTAAINYDHELIRHMTTQHLRFLQLCTDKLSSECGIEITDGLVKDKPMSFECCEHVLNIGIHCHKGMMDFVFSTYELKNIASEFLPKSKRIWNQCVQTLAAPIGAPVAFET